MRSGSGVQNGKLRISALYEQKNTPKERAEYLKNEYGIGGHSLDFSDGTSGFVDYNHKGLLIRSDAHGEERRLSWTEVEKIIHEMIRTDAYLTEQERGKDSGKAPAPDAQHVTDDTSRASDELYRSVKNEHPGTLVGMLQRDNYEFYGEDAKRVSEVLRSRLITRILPDGEKSTTGFEAGNWSYYAELLWRAGNNICLFREGENHTAEITKELMAKDYIPVLSVLWMDGYAYRVEAVDFRMDKVHLAEIGTGQQRTESVAFVRSYVKEQYPLGFQLTEDGAVDEAAYLLEEALVGENGLLELSNIDELSRWFEAEKPLQEVAGRLAEIYRGQRRTSTDYDSVPINYEAGEKEFAFFGAKGSNMVSLPWEEVAAALHAMYLQEKHGFRLHPDQELTAPEIPVEKISRQGDVLTIGEGTHYHEVDITVPDETWQQIQQTVPETDQKHNFRITDDRLGEGTASQKYRANVTAIRTLKRIEAENRAATPEEQDILSRYVGWGGLADCFDERHSKYPELKSLLTDQEYAAARASTLNAHFTSPTVIRAVYEALEQMGFRSGRILEPSMGVGNFFGLLPDSMAESELHGVELDSITGRIAKQLYPGADITVAGFETTDQSNFYDLALGNVPFGQYQVNDPAYNKLGFSIHNYFFAKALDQVRPGGIVAFVTSRYTMDAKSTDARRYLAQRAELLGAIRLPNNAFKANAGTEVVSDILFLQKRERPVEVVPDWVFLGESENGFAINQYFADHPEMVLGKATSESTQYGRQDYTVAPVEGADLAQQLQEAVSRLPSGIFQEAAVQITEQINPDSMLPPPDLPVDSFCVINGTLYFKGDVGKPMQPYKCGERERSRILGMVEIRDSVRRVIQCQLDGGSDTQVEALQQELSSIYDRFVRENGYLTGKMNQRAFKDDCSIYLLSSLEEAKNGETRKTDFFTKRTIRHVAPVTHCETAQEALAVCLAESGIVSIDRIAELTGQEPADVVHELSGRIYRIPGGEQYVTADEYLSGNVRRKLAEAKAAAGHDPEFEANVKALEQVQPVDLTADEIDVRLGSTWIDPIYVKEFFCQLLRVSFWEARSVAVQYVPESGEWHIEGKNRAGYIPNTETYGTSRMKAAEIIERSLNLRDVRVYDTIRDADGKERRVLNADETVAARSKQELIQNEFKDWIFEKPDRRAELVGEYNRRFNSYRNRSYDGSYLKFPGMNPEITLRAHQINAVARGLYGGNTLLAHVVGAGKTYEITAIAMESKRLGMAHKSMIVVPNHLTAQWGVEFLRLYPAAKVLVATERDFSTQNRKRFCTRIATGDWDAVVIGHSQFERIPLSQERQEQFLQEQIDSITEGIEAMKYQSGEHWTIKNMERTRKGLEARLAKLKDSPKDKNVITFEELGVDRIFVDEAQAYKNAFIYTKMQNVAGISQTESQRAFDLYQKIRYLDAETGGRGVIFATGTPISNSMVEMYVMQRYLQFDRLEEAGLSHFDAWASTFGEVTTSMELAPEGTGYRSRTRFAKFHNLPELMSMFQEVADIKTADELKLDVPTAHYETIVAQRTEIQAQLVQELSERASKVHDHAVSPEQDNMLRITSDGRKIGLDQRLIDPSFPDEPGSKVNLAVQEVLKTWRESAPTKGTQLVFCDFSTPTDPKKFNVYTDMKAKLIAAGIPEEQIAFIHDAKTKAAKNELFQKVNDGTVRVLFGSTEKMGAGTNCQERLVAIHDVDCPWRPGDLEQRAGRIVRQGNKNKDVYIKRYVTDATFDAYLYQTVENKQKFISQIMTSKTPVRSCEDVDESVLSYAEIKALCAGDPMIKEKMELDTEVTRLKVLRSAFKRQRYRLEDMVQRTLPNEIKETQTHIARLKEDVAHLKDVLPSGEEEVAFPVLKIGDTVCETRAETGKALQHFMAELQSTEPVDVTTLYGIKIQMCRVSLFNTSTYRAYLKGVCTYSVELGDSGLGNIVRIENTIRSIPGQLVKTENHLADLQTQLAEARDELIKPWSMEEEYKAKTARLTELETRLTLVDQTGCPEKENQETAPDMRSFTECLSAATEKAAAFNRQRDEQCGMSKRLDNLCVNGKLHTQQDSL